MTSPSRIPCSHGDGVPPSVGRIEVQAVLAGPKALRRGRRQRAANVALSGRR